MFAKLTLVILSGAACALALLAMRQSRIVLAHEIAQAQLRQQKQDEQLLRLRTRIAELITPDRVGVLASELGELKPFVAERAGASTASADPARKPAAPTPGVSQPGAGKPGSGLQASPLDGAEIDPRIHREGSEQMIAQQPKKAPPSAGPKPPANSPHREP